MGTIRQREIVAARGGAGQGELEVRAGLGRCPDAPKASSRRRRATSSARTRRRARSTALTTLGRRRSASTFRDNKEGMLGLRVARALEQPVEGARRLHRRERQADRGAGARQHRRDRPVHEQRGADGRRGLGHARALDGARRDAWATRTSCCCCSTTRRTPATRRYWHARGYGLFAANPLGAKASSATARSSGTCRSSRASRPRFRHRLAILPGPFSAEKAEAAWKDVRRGAREARRLPLRAGFVGCGNITDTHARAAREAGLGVAAFVGRDPQKAEAMAARYGGRAFARYEDFLAHRPMDLVVIGSPSGAARRAGHRRRAARPARARREADRRHRRRAASALVGPRRRRPA